MFLHRDRGFHLIAPHIPAGGLLPCKKLYPGLVAHELHNLIPYLVRLLAVLLNMGDYKLVDSRALAFRAPACRQKAYLRIRAGPEPHPVKPGICFPVLVFGIPSSFVRDVAKSAAPYIDRHTVIVNTGKGLEEGSLKTLSEVISEEIKTDKLVVLSGPSHAEEVARCIPTTIVAASKNIEAARYVQQEFGNNYLRIYLNGDVKGCEIGGALKNIIALCVGICDGLGYGDNTKAALMTRGIHEIARLGKACGADVSTFSGLTGIGDLIVTCTSMHSRNRRAGILIGQGISPQEAVDRVGTVEGYICCKAAYDLSRRLGVEMPITEQLNEVLFNGGEVRYALSALMNRPQIYEEI